MVEAVRELAVAFTSAVETVGRITSDLDTTVGDLRHLMKMKRAMGHDGDTGSSRNGPRP